MHSYLRAIGFSKIETRKDLDKVLGMVMTQPTEKYVTKVNDNNALTEISKDFSERMGITVRGEYDEKGFFHIEHYYPHFRGQGISLREEIAINKRVDTDAYTGMCDDIRLGVSLIFYLQNVIDYIDCMKESKSNANNLPVILSGLSTEGKILIGNTKDEKLTDSKSTENKQRNQLIAEARKGNQEAIESLTIDDIDMYAMISRRAKYEDVYSIVETTFIPYGSESDNYSILGTILDVKKVQNEATNEWIYILSLSCNDINYEVCINEMDLMGEPLPGRRFKGNIWMQGLVNFND
jgi:hypothetical protein